jgi:hypothetical protein
LHKPRQAHRQRRQSDAVVAQVYNTIECKEIHVMLLLTNLLKALYPDDNSIHRALPAKWPNRESWVHALWGLPFASGAPSWREGVQTEGAGAIGPANPNNFGSNSSDRNNLITKSICWAGGATTHVVRGAKFDNCTTMHTDGRLGSSPTGGQAETVRRISTE